MGLIIDKVYDKNMLLYTSIGRHKLQEKAQGCIKRLEETEHTETCLK